MGCAMADTDGATVTFHGAMTLAVADDGGGSFVAELHGHAGGDEIEFF